VNTALKALAVLGGLLGATPAVAAPVAATTAPQLFGTVEFRVDSLAALPQWQYVLRRIARERPIYRACAEAAATCPTRGAIAWQALLKSEVGHPRFEQIQAVNQFLNQWQYKTDEQNYGQRDYWATPLEFLRRSGDCEDYAIAKYVSLRQLGFGADDLRLVVLRDVVRDLPHAVLAVYLDREVYILDNLTTAVLPQEQVSQYVPYYSVNETTRWAHVAPADTVVSSSSTRLSSPGVGSR
jgi:predicted transglutaminase-like cysteine proteinase